MEKCTIAIFCHEPHIQRILEKKLFPHFELVVIRSLDELQSNDKLLKIQCLIAYPFNCEGCQLRFFREIETYWDALPLLLIDDGKRFKIIQGCACLLAERVVDLADSASLIDDIQMAIQKYDFKKQISLPETELSQFWTQCNFSPSRKCKNVGRKTGFFSLKFRFFRILWNQDKVFHGFKT